MLLHAEIICPYKHTNTCTHTHTSDDEAAGYMKAYQTLRWGSEQQTVQRLNSSVYFSPPFFEQYLFYETNLFTVVRFWVTQCAIIIMHWFELYPNQSWHKHILFNLLKQHWIKHKASSLSVADCEATPLYINGDCMKVHAATVANLTLSADLLNHTARDMIITDWQAVQKLGYVGYLT